MIIDAHVHVASVDVGRFPMIASTLTAPWWSDGGVAVPDLLTQLGSAGVDGAVVVQASGAYGTDNSYALTAVERDGLVVVAIIDMASRTRLGDLNVLAAEGVHGLRLMHIPVPDDPWLDDPATREIWDECARLGLVVSVCLLRRDHERLRSLLRWAPDVPVVLDHAGLLELPQISPSPADLDSVLGFADDPRIRLKVSTHVLDHALVVEADPAQWVRTLADAFGADRLMWASDWPNAGRDYAALAARGKEASALLNEAEREAFLGGTALALWPELSARG